MAQFVCFYGFCILMACFAGVLIAALARMHEFRAGNPRESKYGFSVHSPSEERKPVGQEYYDNSKSVDGSHAEFQMDRKE